MIYQSDHWIKTGPIQQWMEPANDHFVRLLILTSFWLPFVLFMRFV